MRCDGGREREGTERERNGDMEEGKAWRPVVKVKTGFGRNTGGRK